MAAKILISGATGSVGRVLIRNLVRSGKDVRAGVHKEDKSDLVKMTGVELAKLEYEDFATIDRALQEIETLFLVTPYAREQVEYAKRMIDHASLFGVSHIVYLSIMGADQVPGTQFSRWHRRVEKYLEASSVAFTVLRSNIYMQNFLRFIQPSGGLIYIPMNGAKVSYIDVRDVAAVASEVVLAGKEHFGNTYELTGPFALSMDDVADILTEAVGSHIGYINIPQETARHIMESLGTPGWLVEGMLELYAMQRSGINERVTALVEEITSKKPIPFDQFANDYSNIFKAIVQQEHHTYLS
ncbi:MAG: SDR family oxidoreductase [Fibrobacter sp.]|jgi:uncharacterized protein YbjT (DUF2867 family)|nr:SDR family oxidoreductase [Fibrobacter sp.]